MMIRDSLTTLQVLAQEIQLLKSRIQSTDTGHIYTAIHVLESRVVELENTLTQEENTWYALMTSRNELTSKQKNHTVFLPAQTK